MPKDWDAIARALSSPESSDAEDDLNVMSVHKNAKRVTQLMHAVLPSLDQAEAAGYAPPGMNRASRLREELTRSFVSSAAALRGSSDEAAPASRSPQPRPARTPATETPKVEDDPPKVEGDAPKVEGDAPEGDGHTEEAR